MNTLFGILAAVWEYLDDERGFDATEIELNPSPNAAYLYAAEAGPYIMVVDARLLASGRAVVGHLSIDE